MLDYGFRFFFQWLAQQARVWLSTGLPNGPGGGFVFQWFAQRVCGVGVVFQWSAQRARKLLGSSLHEAQLVTRGRGANLAMVAFPCVPGKAFPDLMHLLDDLHLPSEWEHTTRAAFLDFWPYSFP